MAKKSNTLLKNLLLNGEAMFLPSVSIDCVVFGFHAGQLKVLLLKNDASGDHALAGGFILKNEGADEAAARVLEERTGLKNIFLQQFNCFSDPNRTNTKHAKALLDNAALPYTDDHWIFKRFISIGYYALVEFDLVVAQPDITGGQPAWYDLHNLPKLIIDHKNIIENALATLRTHLSFKPLGYSLLPKYFTLKDLQIIYETVLDKQLDRANFQRKILSYGIVNKHDKHFNGQAHRAPFMYSFNKKAYFEALANGLNKSF